MGEVGAAWLAWMLLLGGSGFAIGSLVVLTMPAPVPVRLGAAGLVFATLVLAVGLNVVGLLPAFVTLYGVFLIPVLAGVGLRRHFKRHSRSNRPPPDREWPP
jgi:hypothetical protein